MFGYINVNREKLKPEDCGMYQSYYCGLCRVLKEEFGRKGQMLLNYDMTFLIVLLTGLYELEDHRSEFVCAIHPSRKQTARCNEATVYAAGIVGLGVYRTEEGGETVNTRKHMHNKTISGARGVLTQL